MPRLNQVEMAFASDDHTGIMVPLFAYGVNSDVFRGVYENTEVFHRIMNLIGHYYIAIFIFIILVYICLVPVLGSLSFFLKVSFIKALVDLKGEFYKLS